MRIFGRTDRQTDRLNGEAINQAISDFKFWFKDFMIELSPLLAFVGSLMLVVDINVRGGLATSLYFEIPWAIVQGIAVEGLLFAVWFHIFGYMGWNDWRVALRRVPAILIGLCMATVGIAMVDVAMYQELYNIADSVAAMNSLHIPVDVFMHSRSVLVVVTSLLAIPFGKRKMRVAQSTVDPIPAPKKANHSPRRATVTVTQASPVAIPQVAQSTVDPQNVLTMSVTHSPEYDRIRDTMASNVDQGRLQVTYQSIALSAGVGYSTVKKHSPAIKKELGIE